MLEVCFNDSVKGALKIAQNCGKGRGGATSIGFISDKKCLFPFFWKRKALREYKKRHEELQRQAVPLGGSRKDIIGVSFGFSKGDIKAPITYDDCPRKECVCSTFSFDCHNEQEEIGSHFDKFWKNNMEDFEKLKSSPDKIRIWLDNSPDAQCGLLFISDFLKDSETEISIVELPKKIEKDDHCVIEYLGWGEVEPELFGTFLDREKLLTMQEITEYSNQWQALKTENASLRVVENGIVVSVDESYYDDLIRKEFPKDSCKIADIIGYTLGRHKLLTGDVFVAKRIQKFIEMGELNVLVNSNEGFYSTLVSSAKKK